MPPLNLSLGLGGRRATLMIHLLIFQPIGQFAPATAL